MSSRAFTAGSSFIITEPGIGRVLSAERISLLRNLVALAVGKLIYKLLRCVGKHATALPGWWALKLSPSFLRQLRAKVEGSIIVIAGTNGKTTTAGVLASILQAAGCTFIHNRSGANMASGLASVLAVELDLWGRKRFNHVVLEVDEAFVPQMINELRADYLLITNFFSDQVDRYGSIETLLDSLAGALQEYSPLQVILNGNDPYSVFLGEKIREQEPERVRYFSLATSCSDLPGPASSVPQWQELLLSCPRCGHALEYTDHHYAQLGHFFCECCHLEAPPADFAAQLLSLTADGMELSMAGVAIRTAYQGLYNAYNVAAAVSAAAALGLPPRTWRSGAGQAQLPAGRQENFIINGQACRLSLYKNPAGLDQLLHLLALDKDQQALLMALTDTPADGRDVSWIWEAQAEILGQAQLGVTMIICSGSRSGDLAVRLQHAGVAAEKITVIDDLSEAVSVLLEQPGSRKNILATYAALGPARAILQKRCRLSPPLQ